MTIQFAKSIQHFQEIWFEEQQLEFQHLSLYIFTLFSHLFQLSSQLIHRLWMGGILEANKKSFNFSNDFVMTY
jgi:hypothetical protein